MSKHTYHPNDGARSVEQPIRTPRLRAGIRLLLTFLALGAAATAIISYYKPRHFEQDPSVRQWEIAIVDGGMGIRHVGPSSVVATYGLSRLDIPFLVYWLRFSDFSFQICLHSSTSTFDGWELGVGLWPVVALFAAYPLVSATAEGVRHVRRSERGLCLHCGYDLRGNVAGICSECGEPFER